jgi:asparagine synthase (glutamine-hydrolysing)
MCGICGIYEQGKDHRQLTDQMCRIIGHRGPDDASVYQSGHTWLGHRRLSIIDLSTGNQPIFDETRDLCIIYNGEIYNYRELREELLSKGYRFYTHSDTEVILKLYQDQGTDSFHRLNGIFAFAICDNRQKKQKIVLVRDHFGVKPLHYFQKDRLFIFASEQKAILLHPAVERRLNLQALHYHLNLRYTPGSETLFEGIHRVPPAHYVVVEDGQIQKIEPYFTLQPHIDYRKSEQEWMEEIVFSLRQGVQRQLVSDVPIGVYLSGGMDSSSIVAMMRDIGVEKISTFSMGFNEPTDELDDARSIAEYYQTEHHEIRMDLNPMQMMPEVIWHAEEPKINLLQGFLMSQFVSQSVKVVLSGLGGDELFSGYDIHRYIYPFNKLNRLVPGWLESSLFSPLSRLAYTLQVNLTGFRWDEIRRGIQMVLSTGNIARFYLILRNAWDFDQAQYRRIYSGEFLNHSLKPVISEFTDYFNSIPYSPLDGVYEAEFHTKMVNDYLLTEDRMSMAHSLEERVPFLDTDLVNLGFSIPAAVKMRGNRTKYLLRKAMKPYLPPPILEKKKWGFTFNPYLQFQKDLKQTAEKILTRKRIESDGIFNYDYIRSILDAKPHPRLRWHYNYIWILTGFYIWKKMYIETLDFKKRIFQLDAYKGGESELIK